jgi:hypothetical protein
MAVYDYGPTKTPNPAIDSSFIVTAKPTPAGSGNAKPSKTTIFNHSGVGLLLLLTVLVSLVANASQQLLRR